MDLIAEAVRRKRGSISLPDETQIRLTRTLRTFYRMGVVCTRCGLTGTVFRSVLHDDKVHLNLFGDKNGTQVLMTCDHIIPQSHGGSNNFHNLQVLCCQCNCEKDSQFDRRLTENAWYSYKSIKDYVCNTFSETSQRRRFYREFKHIQTRAREVHSESKLLCGSADEILQLLYYIREKYGYDIRLRHLKRIPAPIGESCAY